MHSAHTAPTSPPTSRLTGIGLRLLSTFLMASMLAVIHRVGHEVSLGQLIFWRSFMALLPILAYMTLRGQFPSALKTKHPKAHVIRSLFGALSMALSFLSLIYLSVSQAQALAYLAPTLSLPVAAIVLRERLTPLIIFATALGFAGTLMMLWAALSLPGSAAWVGVAAGLGYAVTMSFVRIHIKTMTKTEKPATISFYFAVTCTLVGLASLPFGWTEVSSTTLGLLCLAGLLGGCGHIASSEAVSRAPVSVLAPFDYTGLIWGLLFDVLIFGVIFTPLTLIGAGAIVAAALLVTFGKTAPASQVPSQTPIKSNGS